MSNLAASANEYSNITNAANESIRLSNELLQNQGSFEEFNEHSDILGETIDSNLTRPECQIKTITQKEYEYLKGLPAQIEKLKRSIQKMRSVIQNKDTEIESIKKEMKINKNFSNMSTVRIHILLHIVRSYTYF